MKKNLFLVLVILLFAGSHYEASAQEMALPDSLALTLDSAQTFALKHNRSLKNASLSIKQAYASQWQSIASMLPQVKATYDYSNMLGYSISLMGNKISMPPSGTFGVTASIAFSGSQVVAVMLKKLAIQMSDITFQQNEQNIKSETTILYMSALATQQTLDLLEKNLKNLQNLYEMTENSVRVGASEQTDADQIMVQVSSMQNSINSSKRALEMIYNSLRLQLGVPVGCRITLTQTLDDLINPQTSLNLLKSDFDLKNNYNYQLAMKNTQLSKEQVSLSAMAFLPTVSTYYTYQNKKYFSDAETFNTTPPRMLGVSFSMPLFTSGKSAMSVAEKKSAYEEAKNTLSDTKDQLLVQDKQLRYNLASAYENYETQKKNIKVSQRVFDNTTNKFQHGYSSSADVTNASTTLLTAQSNYIQSLLDIVNADIALKKLLNK